MYIFRHVGYPENCCLFAHTQAPKRVQKQRIFQKKNVDFFGKPCIILICMDTMNIRGSAGPDELAELRNHKKIVGMKQLKKQLRKALLRGGGAGVYLALDADPAITMPLAELAQAKGIEIHWVGKMHDLGRACDIDVGAAAAATLTAQD